eukprot:1008653-Pleurochrysis_carterae.AAC.4
MIATAMMYELVESTSAGSSGVAAVIRRAALVAPSQQRGVATLCSALGKSFVFTGVNNDTYK